MKHYGSRVKGRVLLPDSKETLWWNWLIVLFIIYYAISVPLNYSFPGEFAE
jgi:hypothetical protein